MMARWYALFGAVVALSYVTSPTRGVETPSPGTEFDLLIKGGTVYDGGGGEGRAVDVTVRGDRITGVGDFHNASAKNVIDARGLAIAPGFINMLSRSNESHIQDGRSQSEIRQGVSTEIMGEGDSMGPGNDRVRQYTLKHPRDIKSGVKRT